MTLYDSPLATLRRPRLLMSAARFGLGAYERETVLPRLLGGGTPAPGRGCIDLLAGREAALETDRMAGKATYSIADHVEILTALVAETRLYLDTRDVS